MRTMIFTFGLITSYMALSQNVIPFNEQYWELPEQHYSVSEFMGAESLYLSEGIAFLKNYELRNGTIEFDVMLKKDRSFPGIYFRVKESNGEKFYIRTHQSGNPDSNQAAPIINGETPWQQLYGTRYSFPYEYQFKDWTHVKLVINGQKAQVYLDHSAIPNHSWELTNGIEIGQIAIGGVGAGLHYANFKIDSTSSDLIDFKAVPVTKKSGLIEDWEVSDKFEENELDKISTVSNVLKNRVWEKAIQVEEGTAANISRAVVLRDSIPGNTVLVRFAIHSEIEQTKLFEFGYSDRAVIFLEDTPVYRGNNNYGSRDYRYLGTIGLFDSVYLKLKKGKNIIQIAVSEDFGGWLIAGRFTDYEGIKLID